MPAVQRIRALASRWGGAVLVMAAIFALSSTPASDLPHFGWADALVKKAGHVVGYGLLSLMWWRGFAWSPRRIGLACLLAVLYGITDEIHQDFVPGRQPSFLDVLLFDGGGAGLALYLRQRFAASHRPTDAG